MKNLKLFVAPLLGATLLLTACGPKSMSAEDFKKKVGENYDITSIKTKYSGKPVKATGKPTEYIGEGTITDVIVDSETNLSNLVFNPETLQPLTYTILSTEVVDAVESIYGSLDGVKVNYFISGGKYTVDISGESDGIKGQMKWEFNADCVITHYEQKGIGSVEININYTYTL